jgi:hypothetical protein
MAQTRAYYESTVSDATGTAKSNQGVINLISGLSLTSGLREDNGKVLLVINGVVNFVEVNNGPNRYSWLERQ